MTRILIIVAIVLISPGCAGFLDSKATITPLANGGYEIAASSSDSLVEFKKSADGSIEVKMDNRGRPSLLEKAIMLMFTTDVEIKAN